MGTEIKFLEEVNYLGKEIKVSDENITISDEPIYVELAKPYPDWVDMVSKINSISSNEVEDIIQALLTKSEENEFANRISNYLKSEKPMQHRAALYSLLLLANKINTETSLEIYYHILSVSRDLLSSKLALLEIAKVASTESLGDVALQMNDEKMLKEVSLYFLNLSYKMVLKGEYEKAENMMIDVIKLSPPRYAVDRILHIMKKEKKDLNPNLFKKMARTAGFINDWHVVGPFSNKNKSAENIEYVTVNSIDLSKPITYGKSKLKWQNLKLDGIFPVIPLADLYGRIESAAYGYTEISLDKSIPAVLKIGSNDGVVCWVNGKKVHEKFVGRALTIDEDIVKVNLKKGKNQILLKVLNNGNAWEGCLRVCNSKGVAIDINNLK